MPVRKIIACMLALSAVTPAVAGPSVFWPFGFYFPDKATHHAGGVAAAGTPVEIARTADHPEPAGIGLPVAVSEARNPAGEAARPVLVLAAR